MVLYNKSSHRNFEAQSVHSVGRQVGHFSSHGSISVPYTTFQVQCEELLFVHG